MNRNNAGWITALILSLPVCSFAFDFDDIDADVVVPNEVYTPTKMKQSISDVPGSIHVITKEEIDTFAIQSVKEALLRVPGMVMSDRGSDSVISYHGMNTVLARRVNVQVNGVTLFDPAISVVPWNQLPVTIDQVERIEVNKSPSAATYGSNSFLAVVNIITTNPVNTNSKIVLNANDDDTGEATALYNYKGENTSFNLLVNGNFDDGYDRSITRNQPNYRGKWNSQRVNFHSISDISETTKLEALALFSKSHREPEVNTLQPTVVGDDDIDTNESNVSIKLVKDFDTHKLSFGINHYIGKQDQRAEVCSPTILASQEFFNLFAQNRDYAETVALGGLPTGGSLQDNIALAALLGRAAALGASAQAPICGIYNNDFKESRKKIEVQDIYSFSKKLRMVANLSISEESAESSTYFRGRNPETTSVSTSVNFEYRPADMWTINVGGYVEDNETVKEVLFAPRVGLNLHLNQNHTLRIINTKSFRTPDLFEQFANWIASAQITRPLPNALGLTELNNGIAGTSPGNLEAEEIVSTEIGYNAQLFDQSLSLDIKIFRNELDNLISSYLLYYDFVANNQGEATLTGAEVDLKTKIGNGWLLTSGLAYLDNETPNIVEKTTFKRWSGNLGIAKKLENVTLSGTYQGASNSDNTSSQNVYGLNLIYTGIQKLSLTGYMRYNPNPRSTFVTFPVFPIPGWDTGTPETLEDKNKSIFGIKAKYEW